MFELNRQNFGFRPSPNSMPKFRHTLDFRAHTTKIYQLNVMKST